MGYRLVLSSLVCLIALGGCAAMRHACGGPAAYAPAAAYNAAAERNLAFSPFGRAEQGWAVYEPAIAREARTACPADSPGFARAVARWQGLARLVPHGGVDPATFSAMKADWQQRRPFVRLRAASVCPAPPAEADLVTLPAADSWRGAVVRLRPGAAAALEAMIAAARREVPAAGADPELLAAFSGFRGPDYDAARCVAEGNCDGIVRASCSAHRTGLAVDLALGAAPGFAVDSSADANRLWQTSTPAYRWLLANAGRFGFVNYAFEPWHWEWTGEGRR
ncbi:MAG: D-alanyl-D-alanine carboxypeptidase family protein [Caulobacteraceae bacterium]|nr:D-alanyl-D-alanine carboxypeptidase family protein [Caulobacteraceae bacterium]